MSEMAEMEIAEAAYTEYSRITGGKSIATGQLLPLWCDLPDNIRYAWHGTIYKVVCLVMKQQANEDLAEIKEMTKAKGDK